MPSTNGGYSAAQISIYKKYDQIMTPRFKKNGTTDWEYMQTDQHHPISLYHTRHAAEWWRILEHQRTEQGVPHGWFILNFFSLSESENDLTYWA